METPVALTIFNRPHTAELVFEEIAKAQPRKLFVIADGPRHDRPDDAELCAAARTIIDRVDWQCKVFKNYSEVNLGCGHRQATGLNWVFRQVDRCIILEDDCVPDQSFFTFCEELLERFAQDQRIMHIGGWGPYSDRAGRSYSYFFSRCFSTWGWATWARAWKHYDFEMKLWPEVRDRRWLMNVQGDCKWAKYVQEKFDQVHAQAPNTSALDVQWVFACNSQNGFAIRPYRNLIQQVGVGDDATGIDFMTAVRKSVPVFSSSLRFPLEHPPHMVRDMEADLALILPLINAQHSYHRHLRWRRLLRGLIPQMFRAYIPERLINLIRRYFR